MSAPDDIRLDATLRRYLGWEADQLHGAPTAADMVSRIAAGPTIRLGPVPRALPRRALTLVAVTLLLAALLGAVALLSGRLPFPSVIPDNGVLVVANRCALTLLDPESGTARELVPAPPTCGPSGLGIGDTSKSGHHFGIPSWSADGSRMAYAVSGCTNCVPARTPEELEAHGGAWVADPLGLTATRLAGCRDSSSCLGEAVLSPDGSSVAYASFNLGTGASTLQLLPVDGSPGTDVDVGDFAAGPAYSPDGRELALVTRIPGAEDSAFFGVALIVLNADGTGEPRTLVELGGRAEDIGDIAGPTWSPDGSRILYRTWHREGEATSLWVVPADGTGEPAEIPVAKDPDQRLMSTMAWSPDGGRITYELWDRQGQGPLELWVMNADGSNPVQVYSTGCCAAGWRGSRWSPDGQWIAFAKIDVGPTEKGVFVMRPDGSEFRRVSAEPDYLISWQPIR